MRDSHFIIEWEEYDSQHLINIFVLAFDMDISESSSYRDFVWAIELNRLNLELIGLWPKTDGIAKRRLGSDIRAGFAFIIIAFVTGIPIVHALIRVWGDMVLMIDNLRVTLPMLTVLFKLVIMRWKQS
ncbi:odorant receptor 13a, partial [Lasius niger]